MYSIEMFGRMFMDPVRNAAYERALVETVRPGDVVVDIGTGFGVYALRAAQLGARKVYAIESDPIVALGPDLAARNGLADRVEFIHAMSTDVVLPERADVVVADLRGPLPHFLQNLSSLHDAAERFLRSGGTLIPASDRIFAALVSLPRVDRTLRRPWNENPFGFDLSPVLERTLNTKRSDEVTSDDVLTDPAEIATVLYGSTDFDLRADWTASAIKPGTAHGISVWFEATLRGGITYTTGPFDPPTVYGMAYFPLRDPLDLATGDEVRTKLTALSSPLSYLWSWTSGFADRPLPRVQSTLNADELASAALRSRVRPLSTTEPA